MQNTVHLLIADSARLLSATRLTEFLGCEHRVALWLAGEAASDPADEAQALLRTKGLEHEADVLQRLEQATGSTAVRIPTEGLSLEERVRLTQQAMETQAPLIYQGALATAGWLGFPDFLLRAKGRKDATYRPEDAKLSRTAKRDHVLQIAIYAELLKRKTGAPVRDADPPRASRQSMLGRFAAQYSNAAVPPQPRLLPYDHSAARRCGALSYVIPLV